MYLKPVLLASVLAFLPPLAVRAEDAPAADLFSGTAASKRPDLGAKAADGAAKPTSGTPFVLERAKPAADDPAPNATAPSKEIDISALRYYVSQNDLSRVSAEIRLIRAKHPNWEPPADLFTEVHNSVDEQPLWDLFAKHDLVGLKAAIDDLHQSKPDWQPSSDLTQKLAMAEAHDALVEASDSQRWADVVDIATDNRALLTCADIDALWRTAEALVRLNDEPRAVEAYRYALTNCNKAPDRLATVQKANLLLQTPGAMDQLLALGRRGRDGHNEFESIRTDSLRRLIGDAAAGKADAQPTPRDVEALEAAYATTHLPADAQLLGWFNYARKDFPKAETWFRAGMSSKPDAKSAEGLVLALREQGKLQDALDVAVKNRDLDAPNRKVFIELSSAILLDTKATVSLKPDQISAFTQAVETAQSADGAQAYGWRLYNTLDIAGAETWFNKSMGWKPNEDAAVGLMICAKRLKHDRDYADLVAKYRGQFTRVAQLEEALRPHGGRTGGASPQGRSRVAARRGRTHVADGGGNGWDRDADAIVTTFKAGQYDQALAMLDARKGKRAEPSGLSIVRGWAQYHRGDWSGAQQTFSALQQRDPSHDTETGLRVIQQGYMPPSFR